MEDLLLHLLSGDDHQAAWWRIGDGAPRKRDFIPGDFIIASAGPMLIAIHSQAYVDWDIPNTALRVYRNGVATTVRSTGAGDPYVRIRETGEFVFQEYLPGKVRRLIALDLQSLQERILCEFPVADLPRLISENGVCFGSYDEVAEKRTVHQFDAASGKTRELYAVPQFDQVTHFALASSGRSFVVGLRQDDDGETRQIAYFLDAQSEVIVPVEHIVPYTAAKFSRDERLIALTTSEDDGPAAVIISAEDATIVARQELGTYLDWGEIPMPSCVWGTKHCYVCARRGDQHLLLAWSIESGDWRQVFETSGVISTVLPAG